MKASIVAGVQNREKLSDERNMYRVFEQSTHDCAMMPCCNVIASLITQFELTILLAIFGRTILYIFST